MRTLALAVILLASLAAACSGDGSIGKVELQTRDDALMGALICVVETPDEAESDCLVGLSEFFRNPFLFPELLGASDED